MSRTKKPGREFAGWLAVAAAAIVFLGPLAWMVAGSFKPDAEIHRHVDSLRGFLPLPLTTANYAAAARRGDIFTTLLNSAFVVALIAAGGLLVNTPAAYAFSRMRFPGRGALFLLLIFTIILPLEVIVIPLFMVVRTSRDLAGWMGEHPWTLAALSVPFMAKGFNIFLLRQHFLGLPRSIEESAFIDGAGWWGTFWRIAVPNSKPVLVTVVLLDFTLHWNDFLWPLVICQAENTRTVQLGLGNFFTQPPISWGAILAYAVLATVPLLIAFALGQRHIVRSVASSGLKE